MSILTGKNAIGIIEGQEISINAKYDNLDLLKSAMINHDIDGNFEMLSASATSKLKWKLIDNGIYDDIDENIIIRQKIAKIKAIRKEYKYTDLPYLYANYNHNCNPKYQTEEFVKNLKKNGKIAFSLNETTVYRLDNSLFSFNCDFIICAKLENNDFGSLDNDAVLFRYKDYLRDLIKSYELYLEVAEEVEKLIQAKAA
ncbi:hypothetical protein [Psychrobacter sp. TWP2-1-2]|uniref:hypothetical protein n=1 Tax=Psychrobacter sp. TWP2-1-2 TaxID=2804623 RepID=UPI003CF9E971